MTLMVPACLAQDLGCYGDLQNEAGEAGDRTTDGEEREPWQQQRDEEAHYFRFRQRAKPISIR
jgi:hypothetical protein